MLQERYENAMRTLLLSCVRGCYENATKTRRSWILRPVTMKEYEVEGIRDSTVFAKESDAGHLTEICLSGEASVSTLP